MLGRHPNVDRRANLGSLVRGGVFVAVVQPITMTCRYIMCELRSECRSIDRGGEQYGSEYRHNGYSISARTTTLPPLRRRCVTNWVGEAVR